MYQRSSPAHASYLFTIRLWWEDLGQGDSEWRGIVKLVTNGEEQGFRDWGTLGQLIEGMLSNSPAETPVSGERVDG